MLRSCKYSRITWLFLLALLIVLQSPGGTVSQPERPPVRTGLEVLLGDSIRVIENRRLGLVTNQTGIDHRGRSIIHMLMEDPRADLVRLFAPEHGIDGAGLAGEVVHSRIHPETGLMVTSLYRGVREVDPGLLAGLEAVLFDIQDIGVRPYTFVSTMAEVMKACGLAGCEMVVLDRPNPLGGELVSGLTLDPQWASFIGPYPVPYVHGLTVAELARLFNEEFGVDCELRVVPMAGWERWMRFGDTGLPWIPTSPNVPTWETAWGLSITGALGELGTLSEGVGTPSPFLIAGHPDLDGQRLASNMNARDLNGVAFMSWSYRSFGGHFPDRLCHGLRILILKPAATNPGQIQLALTETLARPEFLGQGLFETSSGRIGMFDRAMGSDLTRLSLQGAGGIESLGELMERQNQEFRELRRQYLIYPEEP